MKLSIVKKRKKGKVNKENEGSFQIANKCHICNKLYSEKDIRVRDHSRRAGKCRSSARQFAMLIID